MRKMLSVAGLVAVLGFAVVAPVGTADAGAVPADAAIVKQSAAASSSLQQVQFAGRRTRHGVIKCYRTLVVGPYRCHHFYRPFSTW
jgi:hypothetical protein